LFANYQAAQRRLAEHAQARSKARMKRWCVSLVVLAIFLMVLTMTWRFF
jgi:hypothetical protein